MRMGKARHYRGSSPTSSYHAHMMFFSHAGRQVSSCYCMLAFTLTVNMVTRAVLRRHVQILYRQYEHTTHVRTRSRALFKIDSYTLGGGGGVEGAGIF